MGISIQQWRVKIGCNRSHNSKTIHSGPLESQLTSPSSSTWSKHASGLSALILILALISSPLALQFRENVSSLEIKCSESQENTGRIYTPGMSSPHDQDFSRDGHQSGSWKHSSRKLRNQEIRALNGNRESRGIRLAHWNAGSAHLHNKMTQLELAVTEHHPHILGISEANFKQDHDIEDVQLADYDLFLSKTYENNDLAVSRVVAYKHHSLVGTLREDLMSNNFSSIWMEVGLPKKKKILVCQLYREWQYLGQADSASNEIQAQLGRWVTFLDQWERAIDTGKEVIVMGDININYLKLDDLGQLQPLADLMLQRIYPHGVQQCVKAPTRSWSGQQDSCLDHIYTNTPNKISQPEVKTRGSSDHKLILVTRFSRSFKESIRYCKKRSYKIFDEQKFLEEVEKISWWEVYATQDVDEAVDIFTNKLTNILDKMAPVKKKSSKN